MRWRAAGTDWPASPRDSSDRIASSIPPAPVGGRISGYILDSSKRRGGPAHGVFVGSLRGIHRSSTDLVPSLSPLSAFENLGTRSGPGESRLRGKLSPRDGRRPRQRRLNP